MSQSKDQSIRNVYMDNAATTPVRPEVFAAMRPFLEEHCGNPSSVYALGREAKKAVDEAREKTAAALNAGPGEIFFTGGGTEADNWAAVGVARVKKSGHIITTAIEHHAMLHVCGHLEKTGFDVTYLPVEESGLVNPADVEKAIRPDTFLISVMFANNEIGTIQPIQKIGTIAREHGVLFHTDAVQAVGNTPIDVKAMNIDMLSLSAHKLYGPKGVGAMYIRKGVRIEPLIFGGGQENKRRAGTENTAGIAGLGTAIELVTKEMGEEAPRVTALRDRLISGILSGIPHSRLNGDAVKRLPGNANISFEFIEGESLLLMLDMKGISASSGSACTSGSLDPSHVLLAIGLPHEKAHGSLRLTLGKHNTQGDVDYVLSELPSIVEKLRAMSPLYEDFIKNN